MAISDDLNSIRTHLEDDYEALEQLGVSVEDRNIENIKDMANQIYAKFPKTSYAEGSNITLSNTLKGKLDFEDGIVGIGDTSQKSYEGYQMIHQASFGTFTDSGITFTQLADGGIKLNGTATANTDVNILTGTKSVASNSNNITLQANQEYTMSCNGTTSSIRLSIHTSSYTNLHTVTGNVIKFTETSNVVITAVRIIVLSGEVINNLIVYPMLEKGSTAHDYEPYVGGTASPSPSYPQDIEVVRGKNLLPNNATTQTVNGVTFTKYDDGSVLVNGTATANIQYDLLLASENKKISAGNYYLSGCPSGGTAETYRLVIGVNGTLYGEYGSGRAVTLSSGVLNSYIYIQNGATVTNKLYKPMLEKGSQVTSYLPYNTLEVVERGKNYCGFNSVSSTGMGVDYIIDKSEITLNGTTNGGGYIYTSTTNFITIPKGTYKLSGYILGGSYNYVGDIEIALKKVSDNTKVLTLYKTHYDNQATITLTEDTDLYYGIYTNGSNNVLNNFKIGIQIEAGSTATDYEPYITPITKQLSLGNFKPSKIGNYKDYFYRTSGKNLFDNSVERKNAYIGASASDIGTAITYYNSSATYSYVNCAYVKAGKTYTLSWKQSTTPASTNNRIGAIVDNNNIILAIQHTWINSSTSITFTPNVSGYLVLCTDINATNIQIELGNTATDYNPFGSGEWYFKGKNNMLTSDEITIDSVRVADQGFYFNPLVMPTPTLEKDIVYANTQKNKDSTDTEWNTYNGAFIGHLYANYAQIYINYKGYTEVSSAQYTTNIRDWLKSIGFYMLYPLKKPIDTKITDTNMITQLEEIYNLMSYTGTTIIEIDGQLPLIIKVSALKGE